MTKPAKTPYDFGLFPYIVLVLTILFVLATRINLLEMPLERDEGGFAYIGKMLLQGQDLYTELHDIKLPGLYYTYGIIMSLFGYSAKGIHTGLLLFNLATIILLFFFTKDVFDELVATIAITVYGIIAVSPNVLGFAAHATQLLLLPSLGALYLFWKGLKNGRWYTFFLSGLLMGYAFTIKQQAIYFMLLTGFYLIYWHLQKNEKKWSRLVQQELCLILGSIIPYVLIVLFMWMNGRFEDFWFWTFEWPKLYGLDKSLETSLEIFQFMFNRVVENQLFLWFLSGLGLFFLFFSKIERPKKVFLVLFLLFMFLGICTGFQFYQHYFVMLLPPLAILVGIFGKFSYEFLFQKINNIGVLAIPILFIIVACIQPIYADSAYYFQPDFNKIQRKLYGNNPFPESVEIAKQLKNIAQPNDEMVVFGSEPQLPFYANIPSVSGHVFIYPIVDGGQHNERLFKQFTQSVLNKKPRFAIFIKSRPSWLSRNNQLEQWMKKYISDHYIPIGMVDIFGNDNQTFYAWGERAMTYKIQADNGIYIFERKQIK